MSAALELASKGRRFNNTVFLEVLYIRAIITLQTVVMKLGATLDRTIISKTMIQTGTKSCEVITISSSRTGIEGKFLWIAKHVVNICVSVSNICMILPNILYYKSKFLISYHNNCTPWQDNNRCFYCWEQTPQDSSMVN